MTRRNKSVKFLLIMALLGTTVIFAKNAWEKRSFSEWTEGETASILRDSPWSKVLLMGRQKLQRPASSLQTEGGADCPAEIARAQRRSDRLVADRLRADTGRRIYTVRFVSARPIRLAVLRWATLKGKISAELAETSARQNPFENQIVVAVSASLDQDRFELEDFSTVKLKEKTFLALRKSKRKIHAERYASPTESGIGEALFYFPRTHGGKKLVTLDEKEIRFESRLNKRTRLNKKFELKKMVLRGVLEI